MGKLSNIDKLSKEKIRNIGKIIIAVLSVVLLIGLIVYALVYSDDDSSESGSTGSGGTSSSGSSGSGSSGSGSSSGGTSGRDCIPPDPVPPEYDISNVTGSLSKDVFSITGVTCATGYNGTATATACSVAGQAYTLTGCSLIDSVGSGGDTEDSSSTNPCSLESVVAPAGGALGTKCANNSASGSLAHGDFCDMTCPGGTTLTNQPQCNNGVLSSITATCTPAPEPAPAPATETVPAPEPSCIRPTDTTITDVYNFSEAVETLTMGAAFNVTGITCNTGYGLDAGGITVTICDSADTAYNVTGCSDTDGCAGVDCGTGATCMDNPAPQTGYTCDDGYTWVLSDSGQTCTDACEAASSSLTCTDGDWGVNSESIFREKMREAGQDDDDICNRFITQPANSDTLDPIRPATMDNFCYPSIVQYNTQICNQRVSQAYRRLCRCT